MLNEAKYLLPIPVAVIATINIADPALAAKQIVFKHPGLGIEWQLPIGELEDFVLTGDAEGLPEGFVSFMNAKPETYGPEKIQKQLKRPISIDSNAPLSFFSEAETGFVKDLLMPIIPEGELESALKLMAAKGNDRGLIDFLKALPGETITADNFLETLTAYQVTPIAPGVAGSAKALSFADFANYSNLTLNGSAKVTNFGGQDVLRLTEGLWQSGNAFLTEAVSLDKDASFSTAFQFQITDPVGSSDSDGQGADGITFVVQTLSNNVGGAGGGIGYEGIANSVGIEFDTWNNKSIDGYNGNHIGINLNGNIDSIARRNLSPRLNDGGLWSAWVDYNGVADLLEVRVSQTEERPEEAFLSYNADLTSVLGSNNAFIGFTSGTGGAGGDHDIRSWQFNNSYKPIDGAKPKGVPEPTSILGLLALGTLGSISMLKRKQQQKILN